MLELKKIKKVYKTGNFTQTALDSVNVCFRDNEFAAILGPSGSGKTTLLNIVGGLDRYDSGDLIINGISTKKYNDKDWDSYRNHSIGFVFQSYNLIGHQSILSNVELALTISGIKRRERKKRAKEALEKVGLKDQMHKRPNQLSGGQMQRVAIARALVNDPDILLADEPTGALDTQTSLQVMDLLKEVASDRLVIMVTHNPELANQYATRIIHLQDGKITGDSNPFNTKETTTIEHKNMGQSSMKFRTSLALSFNNLRTKKARTLLTSFAGSIGIIGIALILSLSSGVNTYISDVQKSTMTSYPIEIDDETIDLSDMMKNHPEEKSKHKKDAVYSNNMELETTIQTNSVATNNLKKFKQYLDSKNNKISKYVGENGIVYSYDTKFGIYTYDSKGTFVNTDGSTLDENNMQTNTMMSSFVDTNIFHEILSKDTKISQAIKDNYEVLYGTYPKKYNDVVLILDSNHEISTKTLYQLGMLPTSEYKEYIEKSKNGDKVKLKNRHWSYEKLCQQKLYLIPTADTYIKQQDGYFTCVQEDEAQIQELMKNAIPLNIVGIIAQDEDSDSAILSSGMGYTQALTNYIIQQANQSEVVKAQKKNKKINILNGLSFAPKDDAEKIEETKTYLSNLDVSEKADITKKMFSTSSDISTLNETQLASMLDSYLANPDQDTLLNIYNTYLSSGSYQENLTEFGVIDKDSPSSIQIYADSFEDKEAISDAIEDYNQKVSKKNQITYTDYVGLLMSSVTTIVNVISYVLIAFVAVSLVVSSIMIGIITYISVLERTKEIGILRAIGASKKNISQVFNAETFIIGLVSGLMGVGISLLLLIPGNAIIHNLTHSTDINAQLPIISAIILVLLATILTMLGGWIPSKKAAKKDPVTALRTE